MTAFNGLFQIDLIEVLKNKRAYKVFAKDGRNEIFQLLHNCFFNYLYDKLIGDIVGCDIGI